MSDNNRILFISRCLGKGGAERVTADLANYAMNQGANTAIVLFEADDKYYINPGVNLYYLPVFRNKAIQRLLRMHGIRRALNDFRPKHIVSLGAYGVYIDYLRLWSKYDITISVRNFPGDDGLRAQLNKKVEMCRKANKVVFQTPDIRSVFPDDIWKKSAIIPNAAPEKLPKWSGDASSRIITFCRLEKQKNLAMLIKAFAIFKGLNHDNFTLTIYGEGPEKQNLQNLSKSLDLGDSFKIMPFSRNIHNEISNAAMFISSSDYEGIQNSLLEAMSMGMPCIATDCLGGGARLLSDSGKNLILVDCEDYESMARAMCKVADDRDYRNYLSKNAIRVLKMYDRNEICDAWYKYITLGIKPRIEF